MKSGQALFRLLRLQSCFIKKRKKKRIVIFPRLSSRNKCNIRKTEWFPNLRLRIPRFCREFGLIDYATPASPPPHGHKNKDTQVLIKIPNAETINLNYCSSFDLYLHGKGHAITYYTVQGTSERCYERGATSGSSHVESAHEFFAKTASSIKCDLCK